MSTNENQLTPPVSQTPPDNAKTQGQDELPTITDCALRLICKKLVVQGPLHKARISAYFRIMREAAETEFTEDNKVTVNAFLQECFDASFGGSDAGRASSQTPAPSLPTVPPKEEKCVKCGLTLVQDPHEFGFRDHAFVYLEKEASSEATHVLQNELMDACNEAAALIVGEIQPSNRISLAARRQSAAEYIRQTVVSFVQPVIDFAEWGWTIMANAQDWEETDNKRANEWQNVAARYRDEFYAKIRHYAPSVGAATDSEENLEEKDALPGATFATQNALAIADHAARNVAHEWLRDLYESSNGAMSGWTTDEMSRYHENLGLLIDFVTTPSVVDGLRSAYATRVSSPKSAVRGQVEGELWTAVETRPGQGDVLQGGHSILKRGFVGSDAAKEFETAHNASIQRLAPSVENLEEPGAGLAATVPTQNTLRCDLCQSPATRRSNTFIYCDGCAPEDSKPI